MKKAIMSILTVWIMVSAGLFGIFIFNPEEKMEASAKTIIVDDDGTPGIDCNYTTIQGGINAADSGDTVFVKNGTYYENVVINKRINLTGEDRLNTIIDSNGVGDVVHVVANWVNITGFEMKNGSNSGSGIYLQSSDYCKIEYCKSVYNEFAIYLDPLSNNNIINNNICSSVLGEVYLDSSSDNIISNNTGLIQLSSSSNNTLTYNDGLICLYFSNGNRIENNNLSNLYHGIELAFSSNNIIKNNICNNNNKGIYLYKSSNNIIENNKCGSSGYYSGDYGIYLEGDDYQSSNNNRILKNICNNNDICGIKLSGACNNRIVNNTCSDNGHYGIRLDRPTIADTNYNIIENNTINSNGYDGICLIDSLENTINNNTCNSNNRNGINIMGFLYISINNVLDNNSCHDNENGIYITESQECIIRNNHCALNNENGIFLYSTDNNMFLHNTLSNNYRGILSDFSEHNTIKNNILWSNILFGMSQESSSNNRIYHNHFIDNTIQAYDDGVNIWNMSYPIGGNYWSDFDESGEGAFDDFNDFDQNILGSDGIVDLGLPSGGKNPYLIDSDSQDNYPLISPIRNLTFLYKGWNLISIPLVQEETDLTKVLEMIDGYYDCVEYYNITDKNDHWKINNIDKPFGNDLNEITEKMGFWIHITEPGGVLFEYSGTKSIQNQSITLYPGWNMVGYPSLTSYNRTKALNNLTFNLHVDSIRRYDAETSRWDEIGPSDYFELGKGYWIHAKTKCEWEVPI